MNIHPISILRFSSIVGIACAMTLSGCKTESVNDNPTAIKTEDPAPISTQIPKTPGMMIVPADNPMSDAKVELGRHLFFDKAMSVDNSTSCSSCHSPSVGLCDPTGLATSLGFGARVGTRNAPALANIGYFTSITWDGKFNTLEEHALAPIFNNIEMGNNFSSTGVDPISTGYYHSDPGSNDTLFLFGRIDGKKSRIHDVDQYSKKTDLSGKNYYTLLHDAWNTTTLSMEIIAKSLAAYERTFISTGSKFDRYNNGDKEVLKYNPQAVHGLQLFMDVNGANCIGCHSGYNFTDQQFHNNGLVPAGQRIDSGRIGISKNSADLFKFRTPSLRNVALSAPYMHDGRLKSLDAVMAFYKNGGDQNAQNKDLKIKPLTLSDQDVADIIEFLKTLTDQKFTTEKTFIDPWGN